MFSDLVLKGMLNLVVTIVRMHCSKQLVGSSSNAIVQNRQLGVRSVELLVKMLSKDKRTLQMLNPDRIMLQSFNLGRLIESHDHDEKELGLTLSLFILRQHPTIVISDICSTEQVQARDTIHKRQSQIVFDCLKDLSKASSDIDVGKLGTFKTRTTAEIAVRHENTASEESLEKQIAKMISRQITNENSKTNKKTALLQENLREMRDYAKEEFDKVREEL